MMMNGNTFYVCSISAFPALKDAPSTDKTVAWKMNQMKNSETGMAKPVTRDTVIDVDLEASEGYSILSAESILFQERVNERLRMMLNRHPGEKMTTLIHVLLRGEHSRLRQ